MFNQDTDFASNHTSSGSDRRLLIFDLFVTGHHAEYILHLVRYWHKQKLSGTLDILVAPQFLHLHPDVVSTALDNDQSKIKFFTISPEEEAKLKAEESSLHRVVRSFQEWNLIHKYVKQLKPTQCLLMYFDSLLLSLAATGRLPCPLSGIYFRPIFHYSNFSGCTLSRHERVLQLRDKLTLPRLMRHPRFQTLFCLDPLAVEHINQLKTHGKAIPLPDPVQIYSDSDSQVEKLKETLGIQPSRITFLMFGVPQKRKGIYQLLEAIALLPSNLCQKLCLLFVGQRYSDPLIQTRKAELTEALPIQVISQEEFIPEQEIQNYFQVADVILAPYQRHIGMSGILVRAAAAQRPVLSSNYGIMGEIVKRYHLGITVDSTVPAEIAQGLARFLLEAPANFCDFSQMKDFALQNSAEKFAKTIFQRL
ncbi:MAG: glycosyltransferase [Symploca sp. SIO3E6]|nr:glycosyltransferase [Caldora sp. SIO3E6]